MQHYYVNTQEHANGQHIVHVPRCTHLPEASHRIYLGAFTKCGDALAAARNHFENANGCYWCCSDCHSG